MKSLPFYSSTRKKRQYPESRLQKAIVQHLLFSGSFFHSVANERQCSVQEHARLKAMGLRKGCADLHIVVDGKSHYMECKAPGEKQSEDQKAFEADCIANGIPYACVNSLTDALKVLSDWGAIKPVKVAA